MGIELSFSSAQTWGIIAGCVLAVLLALIGLRGWVSDRVRILLATLKIIGGICLLLLFIKPFWIKKKLDPSVSEWWSLPTCQPVCSLRIVRANHLDSPLLVRLSIRRGMIASSLDCAKIGGLNPWHLPKCFPFGFRDMGDCFHSGRDCSGRLSWKRFG